MGFMKKPSGETLVKRAHLGHITCASDLLKMAKNIPNLTIFPLDVYGLAAHLGINVVEENLPSDKSGKLAQVNGVWICAVNVNHHPTRRRFTVAHEIAHYLLHKDDRASFDETIVRNRADGGYSPEEEKMEIEANRFASELLMPEDDFRSALMIGSVQQAAEKFNVSLAAAEVRANLLGIY